MTGSLIVRGSTPWLALVCLTAGLAACGERSASVQTYTSVESPGHARVEIGSVVIEFDGTVSYRHHSVTGTSEDSTSTTVEGHAFGLRDGVFYIGPKEYGAVPENARIQVGASGVTVNGEPRGTLPDERKE